MELLFELMNDYNYELIEYGDNTIKYEDLELDEVVSESLETCIKRFIESLKHEMNFFDDKEVREMFEQKINILNKLMLDKR